MCIRCTVNEYSFGDVASIHRNEYEYFKTNEKSGTRIYLEVKERLCKEGHSVNNIQRLSSEKCTIGWNFATEYHGVDFSCLTLITLQC